MKNHLYKQILLLCALLLAVPAVAAAQDRGITLDFRDAEVSRVLESIEKQTGKTFFYEDKLIDTRKKVTVRVQGATLAAVVRQLFGDGMAVRETETHLVLARKGAGGEPSAPVQGGEAVRPPAGSVAIPGAANNNELPVSVRGRVRGADGEPLVGAAVVLKSNARISAVSDAQGNFTISGIRTGDVLQVSYIGYETTEVRFQGQAAINVTMKTDTYAIEEVLVTGYQTISRERATGSFNIVNNELIDRSHASDLSTALLGTTAGLQGRENEDGSIEYIIRGQSSLHSNAAPLIVVDGFPMANGFQDVNPRDVESVTVLKDAAAASIWGARSGNGVIVITTKKGKNKLDVTADVNFRLGQKIDLSHSLLTASSADQIYYEKLAVERNWVAKSPVGISYLTSPQSQSMQAIFAHKDGKINDAELNSILNRLSSQNNRGQISDHLLETPFNQQYNVSIAHGTDRTGNYMSVMYENSVGSFMGEQNDRWRVNFKNTTSVFKWLDFEAGVNIHYGIAKNRGVNMADISNLSPYEMLLNADGTYGTQETLNRGVLEMIDPGQLPYEDWEYNILREARATRERTELLNTRFQAGLTFKLTEGLSFDTRFHYEINKTTSSTLYGEDSYYARDFVNMHVDYNLTTGKLVNRFVPEGAIKANQFTQNDNYTWRNQLNLNRTFGSRHAVSAIAGFEVSRYLTTGTVDPYIFGYDPDSNTGTPLPFGASSIKKGGQELTIKNLRGDVVDRIANTDPTYRYRCDKYVSVYGNLSYSYDDRYVLTGSVRSDASNLITDDPSMRWAPLWSVGVSWNLHNEAFIGPAAWLDRLTARVTYGYNGNPNHETSPFTLISTVQIPSASTGLPYTTIGSRGNPFLRWEKTRSWNAGVDFAVLGNRLFGSLDVYDKKGKDIVGRQQLPPVSGAGYESFQLMNTAEISNRGFELSLGGNVRITDRIKFTTSVNYAYNKNEITNLKHPTQTAWQMLRGGASGYFVEGYAVDGLWAVRYEGMDKGLAWVGGANGAKVSMDDMTVLRNTDGLAMLRYMGAATSPHSLGWNGTFDIYGVNLSFVLTGEFGGRFRAPTFGYDITLGKSNVNYFVRDVIDGSERIPGFMPENSIASSSWKEYVRVLDTLVESSSYIKLKEITVDYTLPARLTDAAGLGSLKVYGQVRDLGCLWTKNRYGYDPNWIPGTQKPRTSFLLGLTLKFK